MDRYKTGEWSIECNQGPSSMLSGLTTYENSFISFQNHRAGVSYEFHTYEALELINRSEQEKFLHGSSEIPGNSISYINPIDEIFCCSTYKGRVKPIRLYANISIQESHNEIPFDRLGSNFPILWSSEIELFSKNCAAEKCCFNVKARAMQSCFYALARMSVVVNNSFVRVLDTRVFHGFETDFILRNYTVRQSSFQEICREGVESSLNQIKVGEDVVRVLRPVFAFTDRISL